MGVENLAGLPIAVQTKRRRRGNLRLLGQMLGSMAVLVLIYAAAFQYLMHIEGRDYHFVSAVYWVLTVMTTLGFGDITFSSIAGQVFTVVVLLSGMLLLFVILPFTFIEFFYAPWVDARREAQAPTRLAQGTRGHLILTNFDPVVRSLIKRLDQYKYSYVVIVPGLDDALRLSERGFNVMVGELDNPHTYERALIRIASMVVATSPNDSGNANITITVRETAETVPVVAAATTPAAAEVLKEAGSEHILELPKMLGSSLARRAHAGPHRAHVTAEFDDLLIAESAISGTPLVGQRLSEARIRERTGATVLGIWQRGQFESALPETRLEATSVLVLGASRSQLDAFNGLFGGYPPAQDPVIIIGGGNVGQAAAAELGRQGIDYRVIERLPSGNPDQRVITGDATVPGVLEDAGLLKAPSVLVTTHDDDANIYLTIYCRKRRPDMVIISRATHERNIGSLHQAGADLVMSYASMGASTIFNLLRRGNIQMVAEGLVVFRLPVPASLAGRTIAASQIRQRTGCTVVALCTVAGMEIVPEPDRELTAGCEMIMIGTVDGEQEFLQRYV
jgi:Trk K+ transport system NAD-binding subunit